MHYFYQTILVQSPSFKEYLMAQGVNKKKIIYYPYYAESFYNIVDQKSDLEEIFSKKLNLVFAGNIGVAQSFDTIIKSVKVASEMLDNFQFIILGEGRDKKRVW